MMKCFTLIAVILIALAHDGYCAEEFGKDLNSVEQAELSVANPDQVPQDAVAERKRINRNSVSEKRIYSASMRPNVVYKLQTALGYASTIDLPEPALKVFIGDQELFKVGVFEKEVIIKPVTDDPDARTNLTIMTQSSRLTFDVTVGKPETADFVIDFRYPDEDMIVDNAFEKRVNETETAIKEKFKQKEEALDAKAEDLSEEKLKEEIKKGNEAVQLKDYAEEGGVRLNLLTISTIGEKAYLRFSIRNLSKTDYKIREMVVGLQTYEKKSLGLRKVKEGLVELPSDLKSEKSVAPDSYQYGIIQFDRRSLKKGEKPVVLLFEDEGERNLRIEGFRWLD